MRSLVVLEDWANQGHTAQRAILWLVFWPLLLVLRLPAPLHRRSTLQPVSVSDWLRAHDLGQARPPLPDGRIRPTPSSSGCRG